MSIIKMTKLFQDQTTIMNKVLVALYECGGSMDAKDIIEFLAVVLGDPNPFLTHDSLESDGLIKSVTWGADHPHKSSLRPAYAITPEGCKLIGVTAHPDSYNTTIKTLFEIHGGGASLETIVASYPFKYCGPFARPAVLDKYYRDSYKPLGERIYEMVKAREEATSLVQPKELGDKNTSNSEGPHVYQVTVGLRQLDPVEHTWLTIFKAEPPCYQPMEHALYSQVTAMLHPRIPTSKADIHTAMTKKLREVAELAEAFTKATY